MVDLTIGISFRYFKELRLKVVLNVEPNGREQVKFKVFEHTDSTHRMLHLQIHNRILMVSNDLI